MTILWNVLLLYFIITTIHMVDDSRVLKRAFKFTTPKAGSSKRPDIFTFLASKPFCPITKPQTGKIIADCSRRRFEYIPGYLGKDTNYIQILDISGNKLKELRKNDLVNFTRMSDFIMRDTPNFHSFPAGFFDKNLLLEKVDVSYSPISNYDVLTEYVTVLNATHTEAKDISISQLSNLKELYASNNSQMNHFPKLNIKAPLEIIDLRYCPMANLTYIDIAPYCLLQQFKLQSSELAKSPDPKQCCDIKNWTKTYAILGAETQRCGPDDTNPCENITSSIGSEAIALREECIKRNGLFNFMVTMIQILLGVIVIAGVAYVVYRYYKSPKRERYDRDTRYRPKRRYFPDDDDEEEEEDDYRFY